MPGLDESEKVKLRKSLNNTNYPSVRVKKLNVVEEIEILYERVNRHNEEEEWWKRIPHYIIICEICGNNIVVPCNTK